MPPVVASSLADALSSFFFSGGCFAAVVVLFGRCFATDWCFVLALLASLATVYPLYAGLALRVAFVWVAGLECPPLLCFFSCHSVVFVALAICVFVCTFLQCFSIFSPLCSCVGQALLDRIKIVSVAAFFLMKNLLRHGCENKISPQIGYIWGGFAWGTITGGRWRA